MRDDDTPRQRPPSSNGTHWDDERRALVGRRRIVTAARGVTIESVPSEFTDDEGTNPLDLFAPGRHERRGSPGRVSEHDLAERLRTADGDAYEAIATLAVELSAAKQRERSANKDLDKQFRAFLAQQPGGARFDELAAKVAGHDQVITPTRAIARWAAGIAFAALLAVGAFLYHRGADEQSVRDQLQQLARDLSRLESSQQGHTP